eukprot:SAG22_NODE_257_length_13543_cov_26.100417_11_plen_110_part_00
MEYDLEYMRHLAKKTDWGAKRIAEFDNTSLLKDMLAIDSYVYSPQFGQDEVAILVTKAIFDLKDEDKTLKKEYVYLAGVTKVNQKTKAKKLVKEDQGKKTGQRRTDSPS